MQNILVSMQHITSWQRHAAELAATGARLAALAVATDRAAEDQAAQEAAAQELQSLFQARCTDAIVVTYFAHGRFRTRGAAACACWR